MEFLGRVAFEATQMLPLLPTYLHLLLSAIFPIYTAAHASLARPVSAAKPEKKKKSKDGDLSDDDEGDLQVVQKIESLTAMDALTFPVMAGATLTSLYFLIKWLEDPAVLNKILAVYFSQMGMFFGAKFLKDLFSTIRSVLLPKQYSLEDAVWHVDVSKSCFTSTRQTGDTSNLSPLPGRLRKIPLSRKVSATIWKLRKVLYTKARLRLDIYKILKVRSPVDVLDIASFLVVAGIVAWQTFVSTPWYLTNFMGFSFCYGSLQMVTPTTGWVGTLILSALFVYDVYFVFFTPMMVTVATKLEVPIKLLFPRPDGCVLPVGAPEGSEDMLEYFECLAKKRTMAMLGLGDIVVPGMMLAFALRFDLYRFYLKKSSTAAASKLTDVAVAKKPKYMPATGSWGERFWTKFQFQGTELKAKSFPKPYFHASVFGYLTGMVATMVVMQVFQHAQPALLYLVPGVLLSMWGTALVRGDLKLLWAYTEDQEDEEKEKKGKDPAKVENGEKDKTEAPDAATSEKKTDQKPKRVTEDTPTSLISFSITLPARKSSSTEKTDAKVDNSTSSPNGHTTKSTSSSSADTEGSYDVIPDIKADHEILDKLSREISQLKEEASVTTGMDGKPASKRRRKA
jgi:minor histocompatibility antigen H13